MRSLWLLCRCTLSAIFRGWARKLAPGPPWKWAARHYRIALASQTRATLALALENHKLLVDYQKNKRLLLWVLSQLTQDELDKTVRGESWSTPNPTTNSPGGKA